jgi:hypothetical protein
MTTSDKLREFGQKVMREYGRWWGVEAKDADKFVSDLTALISENYYPKEFTEWVGQNNAILCYVNIRKIWVRTRFVLGENPHEEYDEYTTEELFEYWKINEQ